MSKCNDCPCNQEHGELTIGYCMMEGGQTLTDVEHDCPYAPILKLLAEAEEVDGPKVGVGTRYDTEIWEVVTFWIRRGR